MELYPLKFKTIFKEKIWGGSKIKDVLGKDFAALANCGETWELSGVPDNVSIVKEGPLSGESLINLLSQYKAELVGCKVYEKYGDEFPLLVKFIDANDDLSIQVHPNNLQAKKYNSFGKSEMWYIMQADPGAELTIGFEYDTNRKQFQEHVKNNKLMDSLNIEKVEADDIFYIPAGRIHSIGKGILLAEIQQSSDITFRIYDFDRTDAEGNKRELHIEDSLDVIDYKKRENYETKIPISWDEPQVIVENEYFVTTRLCLTKNTLRDYSKINSFSILTFVYGAAKVVCKGRITQAKMGDVLLIPAEIPSLQINPVSSCKLLETYIPES